MRGFVHHIDLTVKNAKASYAFYESVLGFMGYKLQEVIGSPDGVEYGSIRSVGA